MPAAAHRGFTLVELLIVLVLIGILGSMAVLAMGQADQGRNTALEVERLLRLLQLAQQEATLRGEVLGVEFHAGGYRFLQQSKQDWQVSHDGLFLPRQLNGSLRLSLKLDGNLVLLANQPTSKPSPQLVLVPNGDSGQFRIGIGDQHRQMWLESGVDGELRLIDDKADS